LYFDFFVSETDFPWEVHKVGPAKMEKIILQCNRGSLWTMRRLNFSYQRIDSWDAATKLARPSKYQTCCLCRYGIGEQLFYNSTAFVIKR